jgi:hypothetical protein
MDTRQKKGGGLLSSATFQVIFQAVQFICCDLQIIYDQSFCYLCVRVGNLCLHMIVMTHPLITLALASIPINLLGKK